VEVFFKALFSRPFGSPWVLVAQAKSSTLGGPRKSVFTARWAHALADNLLNRFKGSSSVKGSAPRSLWSALQL
jgi:hypothetical protein